MFRAMPRFPRVDNAFAPVPETTCSALWGATCPRQGRISHPFDLTQIVHLLPACAKRTSGSNGRKAHDPQAHCAKQSRESPQRRQTLAARPSRQRRRRHASACAPHGPALRHNLYCATCNTRSRASIGLENWSAFKTALDDIALASQSREKLIEEFLVHSCIHYGTRPGSGKWDRTYFDEPSRWKYAAPHPRKASGHWEPQHLTPPQSAGTSKRSSASSRHALKLAVKSRPAELGAAAVRLLRPPSRTRRRRECRRHRPPTAGLPERTSSASLDAQDATHLPATHRRNRRRRDVATAAPASRSARRGC